MSAEGPGHAKTAGREVSSRSWVSAVPIAEVRRIPAAVVARRLAPVAVRTSNGGTALEATFSQPGLRLDRCDQRSGPHDIDDAGKIVGEHV